MSYLLDTMVLSFFAHTNHLAELAVAAKSCPMAVVEEVQVELESWGQHGPMFKKWLPNSGIVVQAIQVGSPASTSLGHLIKPGVSKGRGEVASIALAAHDSALTFVSHDKQGLWIALRQLWQPGERIIGASTFLRRLAESGSLALSALDDVANRIDAAHRPTWWADWRTGLTAAAAVPPTSSG